MSSIDNFELTPSQIDPEIAEVKVDLRGISHDAALSKLDLTIKHCQDAKYATLLIRFDPARPGKGETLFQPIGNIIKDLKKEGAVHRSFPVMEEKSGGFFVVFKI